MMSVCMKRIGAPSRTVIGAVVAAMGARAASICSTGTLSGMGPTPEEPVPGPAPTPTDETPSPLGDPGATTRINLRLPEDVKARVETAAAQERISVNAWLVRAAVAALQPGQRTAPAPTGDTRHRGSTGQSFTGWAR